MLFRSKPTVKAIQKLATAAGFSSWEKAQQAILETVDTLPDFDEVAQSLGVKNETIRLIKKQLNQTWQDNK